MDYNIKFGLTNCHFTSSDHRMKNLFALLIFFSGLTLAGTSFAQDTTQAAAQKAPPLMLPSIPFPLVWEQLPQKFEITSRGIIMDSGEKTDLYSSVDGSKSTSNVPKLLFKPDSDFIFTVKVKPDFQKTYDGGALIVYHDSENWGKLLFEQNVDGTFGIWTTVSNYKSGDDNFNGYIQEPEVFLKMAKSGNAYCFYYSVDGKKWTVLRAFPIQKSKDISIGFSSQSPLGANCRVEFSEITYRGERFTDFYSGE